MSSTLRKMLFKGWMVFVAAVGLVLTVANNQVFAQGTWTQKAAMLTARTSAGAGVVGGILYVVGGLSSSGDVATLEAYDPAANSWTRKTPMPTARNSVGVGVVKGILYVVGGWRNSSTLLTTLEAYDPITDSWTTKASMPTARFAPGVGVVDGMLYVVGGNGYLLTVEAYDPGTDRWTSKASAPTAHYAPAVGELNGLLYVAGNDNGGGRYSNIVEVYDHVTNTWTTKAPMATPRSGSAYGVVNGIFYVGGGQSTGYTYPTSVEAYDPVANAWTTETSMPAGLVGMASGVINGVLYAAGGYNGTSIISTVEAFTPGNSAPTADPVSVTATEDTAVAITLTGSDPNNDPLTFTVLTRPANGTLSGATPNLTYTPAANFNGSDSFMFKVDDGSQDSSGATVSITVNGVNDAPVATNDAYTVAEDSTLVVSPGVLANDTDVDSASLSAVLVAGPASGTLSLNSTGSFTYTPNSNFNGSDSFTYKASDGVAQSNTATVTITVTAVNDSPVLTPIGAKSVSEGQLLQFTASAADVDGDSLSFSASGLPSGAALNAATGVFQYTPTFDVSTSTLQRAFDVTFSVSDTKGGAANETVRITVVDVPGGTAAGTNVVTQPRDTTTGTTPVTLTFANVTQPGMTSLTTSGSGALPPVGFRLGSPATYYEITTTAVFSGSVTVCINYTGVSVGNEAKLKLFHQEGGVWINRTVSLDTTANIVCASVTSLSPFAIFEEVAEIAVTIDIKPGSFPNSINLGSQGTVPVAIFSTAGFDARTVDPLTVTLARAPVQLKGKGTPMASFQDINGDGLLDLVVHVSTEALQLSETDTQAVLEGRTFGGIAIRGEDSVRIVP